MPENIENRKARRKREAVRGIALFALLQIACAAAFLSLCWIPGLPGWLLVLFAVLSASCIIPLLLSFKVLRQRFQEIEGGELDAADQY